MKLSNAIVLAVTMSVASAHAMLPNPENAQQSIKQAAALQIDTKLNAFLVRKNNIGEESLQPLTASDTVTKGDVVEYQGLFTNQDTNRVRSMNATLDIPNGAELIGGVSPSVVMASVDGKRFTYMPIRANINGQVQELPLSYYKTLRWTIEDLGIGATAVVKYRVVIK